MWKAFGHTVSEWFTKKPLPEPHHDVAAPPGLSLAYRLTWARTVWGESRGELAEGRLAVAFVPWNRAQISGRTVAAECMRSFQFSCWNKKDPNRAKMLALQAADLAPFLALIDQVMAGTTDPTGGATFYHTMGMAEWPAWSHGHQPCAWIGHHVFYKNIPPYVEHTR